MPWVRFDDQYPIHRKIGPLTDSQYRLANEAIFWSSRNTTDGRIGAEELKLIRSRATLADARELVRRGIWHDAGHSCSSEHCPPTGPDGWVIHDYWDYQPSREKVVADREAKAARQQRWRASKGRPSGARDATGDVSTKDGVDASRDGPVDASRDASGDAAPYPPRPAPKEAGRAGPPRAPDARRQAADAAAAGREQKPKTVGAHSPPNGQPPDIDASGMPPSPESRAAPPPDLTHLRQQLAATARQRRAAGNRRPGAFEQLISTTGDQKQEDDIDGNSEEGQP
jgi:hypothetical protein